MAPLDISAYFEQTKICRRIENYDWNTKIPQRDYYHHWIDDGLCRENSRAGQYERLQRRQGHMTNDSPTHILARLEIGFRTDAAHLKALEADLAVTLQNARNFGREHGSPEDWNTNWHRQWDNVEEILRQIKVLVNEMDGAIESSDHERFKKVLETWETFQFEDVKLVEALSVIRTQVTKLNAAVRNDWNLLARTLESHFETIHACAQALRIKLELLKENSRREVDQHVQAVLAKLPNRVPTDELDAGKCEQAYREAAAELKLERHKFTGFLDVVKGLLLWNESTSERAGKNLTNEVLHH